MLTVHSLNDGLLSVRLQLGYVDARGVGEGAAEAQNRLEALFSQQRSAACLFSEGSGFRPGPLCFLVSSTLTLFSFLFLGTLPWAAP